MRILKSIIIIIILLASVAAAQSTSDWWGISAAAGRSSSESYQMLNNIDGSEIVADVDDPSGTQGSAIGFLAGLLSFLTPDTTGPVIENITIDSLSYTSEVRDGDYVNSDALLVATVRDSSGVDASQSEVGVDTTLTAFDQLPAGSSYVGTTLTNQYALADGSHVMKINAYDTNGNLTTWEGTFLVDSTNLKSLNLLIHPTPYNPNQGSLQIGYQLSKDSNIQVFIFNAWNQLIYQRQIPTGQEGARAGYNQIVFTGITNFNEQIKPGLYKVKIAAEDEGRKVAATIKFVVLK